MKINGKDVRLPKRFKEKWVKALRSGKYNQSKKNLYNKDTNSFCCLGVACSITYKGDVQDLSRNIFIYSAHKFSTDIPKLLIGDRGIPQKLAEMNDTGKSFNYIASYIERYL